MISFHQKQCLQKSGTLAMKEIVVPPSFYQLRHHSNDLAIRVLLRKLHNIVDDRTKNEPIGRLQRH